MVDSERVLGHVLAREVGMFAPPSLIDDGEAVLPLQHVQRVPSARSVRGFMLSDRHILLATG